MRDKNLFVPLIKTLDKIFLGIDESDEPANCEEFIEIDTEEEFDVRRSNN